MNKTFPFPLPTLATFIILNLFLPLPFSVAQTSTPSNNNEEEIENTDFENLSIEENIKIIEKNLNRFASTSNWSEYVNFLNEKSLAYYYSKNYQEFIPHSKFTHNFALEKNITEETTPFINSLIIESIATELLGNYKDAISLQTESARLRKGNIKQYYSLEGIGNIHEKLNDFDEAIRNYQFAKNLLKDQPDINLHDLGRITKQIAYCHKEKGNLEKSLNLYHESLSYLNQLPPTPFYLQTHWYANKDLSDLYLKLGKIDSAMHYSMAAISIQKNTENILEAYKTYIAHGDVWLAKKDYKKAIFAFDMALELAEKEYNNFAKHPSFAICLSKEADTFKKSGELNIAIELYQKAMQKIAVDFESEKYFDNPSIESYIIKRNGLDILAAKAEALFLIYEEEKKPEYLEAAFQAFSQASDLIRIIRQEYLAEGSKHMLAKKTVSIYERSIETAIKLYDTTGEKKYLEAAYSFAEGNKATLLYESMKNNLAKGNSGIPDTLLDKETELKGKRNFYQKLIKEEHQKKAIADDNKINKWEKLVFELGAELEKLTEEMELNYPAYLEQKKQTAPASVAIARLALPDEHTALIEYMLGEEKGYVFFLTKNDLKIYEIENIETLATEVSNLRQLISSPPRSDDFFDDYQNFSQLSEQLFQKLLGDGIQEIPSNIKNLIIVPDDVLCFLPFEILLTEKNNSEKADYSPKKLNYLFEEYAISYQYSASLMSTQTGTIKSEENYSPFIGLAPTFGEGASIAQRTCSPDMLYSLQCNQEEIIAINELMEGEALLAENAVLENFLSNASQHRIIHLATHACVNNQEAALSKIYFTDSSLTQLDLDNLQLNADMTVLSACNTGTGKLLRGEGVMSLTRGFMLAGSRSVLTSLWSVDDCATSDIMVNFYQNLKKGMAKDEALRQSKLDFLSTADRNSRHPYFWAAFTQYGSTEALGGVPNNYWPHLLGLALLGLALWYFIKRKNKTY